jgi:hypothetical protein
MTSNPNLIKVTGSCDNPNCDENAESWYGNTSRAHCGNAKCEAYLDEEAILHEKELNERLERKQEAEDDWGAGWDESCRY